MIRNFGRSGNVPGTLQIILISVWKIRITQDQMIRRSVHVFELFYLKQFDKWTSNPKIINTMVSTILALVKIPKINFQLLA